MMHLLISDLCAKLKVFEVRLDWRLHTQSCDNHVGPIVAPLRATSTECLCKFCQLLQPYSRAITYLASTRPGGDMPAKESTP